MEPAIGSDDGAASERTARKRRRMRTLAFVAAMAIGVSSTAAAGSAPNGQPSAPDQSAASQELPPPPPSAVTIRPVSDGASTIAELRARRLRVPRIQPGQQCPKPEVNLRVDGVGPIVSPGPVAATVFSENVVLAYEQKPRERPHPVKVLWLVQADQRQPVIVRGKRVDGRGTVQFFNGERWFRTYPLTRDVESTAPPEWRDIPSNVRVPERGCYAFQIDGPDIQSVLVVPAEPKSS